MVTIPRLLLPRTNERASPHVRYCIADILDYSADSALARLAGNAHGRWLCEGAAWRQAGLLRAGEQAGTEHEVASAALSQLEGGDAEHPLQTQRWDRAGIHARSLEYRREP